MIIKKAVFKKVKEWTSKRVSDEVHGCDLCEDEIKDYPNEGNRLELTVFNNDGDSKHLHFCSWDCVIKYIPKIKSDYFVTLPYLYFDKNKKGKRSAGRLINILKKII